MPKRDRSQAVVAAGLTTAVLFFLVTHFAALFTEGISVDEVALLDRARQTLASGKLETAGRPGLATLGLLPFMAGCEDPIWTARHARLAWAALTLVLLAGLYALVAGFCRGTSASGAGPALAVAVLALAPPFLRWSLQVRADQLALACALWGGAAILAPAARRRWALVGGGLMALGYLASQKALYVVGLVGLLALGQVVMSGPSKTTEARRRLLHAAGRMGLGLGAGLAGLLVYRGLVGWFFDLPPPLRLAKGLEVFGWYREVLGFGPYWGMLPGLWPQIVLLGLLVTATALGLVRRAQRATLLLAWATLGLGALVGLFHAGAFPYFWMTLGLFPAVALGVSWDAIQRLLGGGRLLTLGAGLLLVVANVAPALSRLEDTQEVQRQSLAFVERHFPPPAEGYSTEGALFCRPTPDPLPRLFSHHIDVHFSGPQGEEATARFIEEFRRRPIAFIIASPRLERFPKPFGDFLRRHYVLYRHAVMIPGLRVNAHPGREREFEILAAGPYRLWSLAPGEEIISEVDGHPLAPGASLPLQTGRHRLRVAAGTGLAILAYDVAEPPAPGLQGFFSRRQNVETGAYR